VAFFLAAATAAVAGSGKERRRRGRAGRMASVVAPRLSLAPTLSDTAPTMPIAATITVPRSAVNPSALFDGLWKRSSAVVRAIAGLQLPMVLLSAYTAVPILSVLGATLCPSPTRAARGLAGALGCILGTGAGAFLKRAKKDAARCQVLQILSQHFQQATPVEELRSLVDGVRRRFGVAQGFREGDAFEESALCAIYQELLSKLLEGPEHDAADLPTMQRLKAALDLDGIVVGFAHKRAAQLLVSAGYSGLEGEDFRVALDKLLFLSERAFADDEPEEARIYEMNRLQEVLRISESDARERVAAVSKALYRQNLSAVADQVDSHTAEALAGASEAFGLAGAEAARMNAETYRQIAAQLLEGGRLAPEGKSMLERARGVLQLGDRAATTAFTTVAAPYLRAEVDGVASSLRDEAAATPAEKFQEVAATLSRRRQELGLPALAAVDVVTEGLQAKLRSLYDKACKDARSNKPPAVLVTLDKMLAFAGAADTVLSALRAQVGSEEDTSIGEGAQAQPFTLTADQLNARRLYGIYLERSLDGEAAAGTSSCEELAALLELSEADEEAARVEVCQPRLHKLYDDSIKQTEADPAVTLQKAKVEVNSKMALFRLPAEAVEETALKVYKGRIDRVAGRVIKAPEKDQLDAARGFLELTESDVRLTHLKAFGKIYEASVDEAMGRQGIMSPEAKEALQQLRERLGISEDDATKIFHGTVEERLKDMMSDVREAWEEATYTKEALIQINKERGKDIGDDPSADGSGAELGIKDSPKLEGVRGFKLMTVLTQVSDFYLGNKVIVEGKDAVSDSEYPVTVGKYMDDKTKEEIYGIFAWNAVTCQDGASRDVWERAKPHVGGILGLDQKKMQKVLERMVSRWCNMFIKQKLEEQGKLSDDDVSTLTNWVPQFFKIDQEATKEMVQAANKGLLSSKVLRLINQPVVTPDDVQKLRDEVDQWDLRLEKDLELTKPQLRSLFRIEVTASLEDADLSHEQKRDAVAGCREGFGLGDEEAVEELRDLLHSRCKGCLVNAAGDLMQGNEAQSIDQMRRLELLAAFAADTGVELQEDWEMALSMRQKLVKAYAASAAGSGALPDVRLLENTLGLVIANSS